MPILIGLLDTLYAITADLQYFFEDFIHDFNGPRNQDLFCSSSPYLEKTTIDLIDGDAFNRLFGIIDFSQFGLDVLFIKVCDGGLIREELF